MFYAVNMKTKEHRRWPEAGSADRAHILLSTEWCPVSADADGWIPWEGGECPLPAGHPYETRHVNGGMFAGRNPETFGVHWRGHDDPVVAYRPILDEPESPEWDGIAISVRGGRIVGATIPKGFQNGIIRISGAEIEIQEE